LATTVRSPTDAAEVPDTVSGRLDGFHPPKRREVCQRVALHGEHLGLTAGGEPAVAVPEPAHVGGAEVRVQRISTRLRPRSAKSFAATGQDVVRLLRDDAGGPRPIDEREVERRRKA
jgi:hypothetical protein